MTQYAYSMFAAAATPTATTTATAAAVGGGIAAKELELAPVSILTSIELRPPC